MRWNLRMVAAQRGVWKASDLRRALAEAGLTISAGKMSYLWSGTPVTVRLDDLDVICAVLQCSPGDLLQPDPPAPPAPATVVADQPAPPDVVRPVRRRRATRTAPPV